MSPTLKVLGKLTRIAQTSDARLRRAVGLGLFEEGVGLSLGVVAPFLLKATIDDFQQRSGVHSVALVALLVASWTAPSAIAGLRLGHSTVLVRGLYGAIAEALLRHEIPRLSNGEAGGSGQVVGLLERLPLDLQLVLEGLVWRAAPLTVQTLLSLASLACTLSPFYAILMGATLATCAAIADRGAVRLKTDVAQANAKVAQASLRLSDVATNAHRIVCNGALDREVNALAAFADDRFGAQRQVASRIARSSALQALVVWSGLTLVLGVAATGAAGPRLALSDFILLQAFAFRLALPLNGLIAALRQLGLPLVTIEQALERGEPRPGRAQAPFEAAAASQARDKALILDAVSFTYPGGGAGVTTVTLGLQAGQLVALVGANGSGKSTLARLMAGLIAPDTGRVVAGGVALRGVAPPDRTKLVLYVPQFISLFNRSILDNGLYPPASFDPAALAEHLSRWRFQPDPGPLDLNTPVGERGQKLSGGQVQKLELARLCNVDASTLILDESTSALDAPSEAEALNDLQTRRPNRLLILVTHRLAIVERADQVVFMRAGRLAGRGRHDALLADHAYARLWG